MAGFFSQIVLAAASIVLAHSSWSNPVLAVEDSWPPYADELGEGISTRIIRAAYAQVGLEPTLRLMPYARVLNTVLNSRVHGGYNVTRQTSTEGIYYFGRQPLLQASASMYFANRHFISVTSLGDLPDGFRIGVIRGYEYGNRFDEEKYRFKLTEVSRQSQLLRMLMAERIDGAVMFDAVAVYTIMEMNIPDGSIHRGFNNHTSDIYVAFDLRQPEALEYAELLDQGLSRLKDEGIYESLLEIGPSR